MAEKVQRYKVEHKSLAKGAKGVGEAAMNTRTSTRYYTDPLAAAWMTKHFAMRFTDQAGNEIAWRARGWGCWNWQAIAVYGLPSYDGQMFIIHPDSLPLLEPQTDDLCVIDDHLGIHGEAWQGGIRHFHKDKRTGGSWDDPNDVMRILQRNGQPFFYPELENEDD